MESRTKSLFGKCSKAAEAAEAEACYPTMAYAAIANRWQRVRRVAGWLLKSRQ